MNIIGKANRAFEHTSHNLAATHQFLTAVLPTSNLPIWFGGQMRSMFRPISAIAMGFLIVTLISCSFADAQLSSAAVNGVVLDPSGAAIPGAKVTLRSVDNGGARDTLTNQSGNYVFVSV